MKQNLIIKISVSALISALLICVSMVTSLIKIGDSIVIQFSDGIFMSLVAIIPGTLMIMPALVYPLFVDLFSGLLIFIPISIVIRLLMFLIIKTSRKIFSCYLGFFLASIATLIYVPFNLLLFHSKPLALTELVVDSIQILASITIASILYYSLGKSSKFMEILSFEKYKFQNSRWLFSDFDGTISFNENSKFDKKSIEFINEIMDNHTNNFVITTGRLYEFISQKNSELNVPPKYTICGNGSLVYSQKGEIIYFKEIIKSDRKKLVEFLKRYQNLPIDVAINGFKTAFHHAYNPNLDNKRTQNKIEFEDYYEMVEPKIYKQKNVTVFYLYTEKDHQKYIEEINQNFANLRAFQTSPYIVEIVNKDVSKWSAIQYLVKKSHLNPNLIFACGDGANDKEMLENCLNSAKMLKSSPTLAAIDIPVINNISEIMDLTSIFDKN
ncbi:HAD-IIB family hydrolase [Spiroplasma endosymbiont of Panorpa germanica]|uniref:HAD-IIB family hydrolase n=1 Tax=Spiroplasma endosymbiont of Panorpa germanica TaxID=3066314 RepID=UPI0030CFAC0E